MISRRIAGILLSSMVCFVLMAGGCERKSAVGEQHADSPRAALLALLRGMKEADAAQLIAITQASDEQKRVIEAGAEFTRTMAAFRDAFLGVYGADAWEAFQDPSRRPDENDASFPLIGDAELLRAETMTISAGANDANCTMPNGAARVRMIRTGDGWLIDGRTFVPEGESAANVASGIRACTAIVRQYQSAIGQAGITPGDIDTELGRAMRQVLRGHAADTPRRFEIAKFATSAPAR